MKIATERQNLPTPRLELANQFDVLDFLRKQKKNDKTERDDQTNNRICHDCRNAIGGVII